MMLNASISRLLVAIAMVISVMPSLAVHAGDFEETRARIRRQMEQQKRDFAKTDKEFQRNSKERDRQREEERLLKIKKEKEKVFNPSAAPKPEVCFASFLKTARAAKSMEEILPYLTMDDRDHYIRRQSEYSVEAAAEKRKFYESKGDMEEDAIEYLTNSAFTNGLDHHKSIADKVRKFISAKVDGDKAYLQITIRKDLVVNGISYSKGTATVGMVGEGNYWRFDTFKESPIGYR